MIWKRPYPAPTAAPRNLLVAGIFGAFISFFLIFFEPFGLEARSNTGYLLGFGGITAGVLLFFLYLLPLAWPNIFADARWTVQHQTVFCLAMLLVIATLNGLYTNYHNALPFSWANYGWIISRTFVLGGIPFSFLILVDYHRKHHYNQEMAQRIRSSSQQTFPSPKPVVWTIATDLKNESFSLDEQTFSHAVADGNYIDVYTVDGLSLACTTYRLTLTGLASQINTTHLQRCHRSYLVNLQRVVDVTGNAQGLQLTLTGHEGIVPVSRRYVPAVRAYFARSN